MTRKNDRNIPEGENASLRIQRGPLSWGAGNSAQPGFRTRSKRRHRSWSILLLLTITGATMAAADNPYDPSIYATSNVWREIMPEVIFWVNFEKSSRPVMGQPDTEVNDKKYEAVPGLVGNALCSQGGSACEYSARGNLDFSRPGSLSFWASAKGWDFVAQDEEPYNVFFSTPFSPKGYLGFERQGVLKDGGGIKRNASILFFLLNFPGTSQANNIFLRAAPESDWAEGVWHFFVLNWSGSLYRSSMDGEPLRTVDIGRSLAAGEVGRFVLGGSTEPTLIDEFMIYRRPLTNKEIADIYSCMTTKVNLTVRSRNQVK